MIINVIVAEKNAIAMPHEPLVCGNSDYVIDFKFDAEWDAHPTKTARFIYDDRSYTDVVFSGTQCPVPVLNNTHEVLVGVFAGNLKTTTPAYLRGHRSILCYGGEKAEVSQDLYDQIMQYVNDAEYRVKIDAQNAAQSAESAQASATQASDAVAAVKRYSDNADAKAQAAGASAQVAEEKAQIVVASVDTAITKAREASESASVASESANSAESSASNAMASADQAAEHAQTASEKAAMAEESATRAATSETNAKASQTASSESAQMAAESARAAAESAQAADKSERNAGDYSSTASNQADSAKSSAASASKSAQESAQSASDAAASAQASNESAESAAASAEAARKSVEAIPDTLPNPHKLTIGGAVEAVYDGSESVSVEIPKAPEALPNPHKLSFSGAVNAEYDGGESVSVAIPDVFIVKGTMDENYNVWADRTLAEVRAAKRAGKAVIVVDHNGKVFHYVGEYTNSEGSGGTAPTFFSDFEYDYGKLSYKRVSLLADGRMSYAGNAEVRTPTPHELTFTGAVEKTFNGSTSVSVDIPDVYIVKATFDEQSVLRTNRTQAQIRAAARAGKTCILVDNAGRVFNYYGERESAISGTSGKVPTFIAQCEYINGTGIYFWQCQISEDGRAVTNGYKPAKTPNPRALIFTGAVNASYTGSEQVTINIPTGVTLTVDADGNATI